MSFVEGRWYEIVLRSGDAIVGEYIGDYTAGPVPSPMFRAADGSETPVLPPTIASATDITDEGISAKGKPLEAVRVRFSCGHEGGVFPEDARPGMTRSCLACREVVEVVGPARDTPRLEPLRRSDQPDD